MFYVDLPDLSDKAQTPGALRRLIAAGRVTEDTLVHPHDGTEWVPAGTYPELWEEPAAAAPPPARVAYHYEPTTKTSKPMLATVATVLSVLCVLSAAILLFAGFMISGFGSLFGAVFWWAVGDFVTRMDQRK